MEKVLQRGLFTLEGNREFAIVIYASSVTELLDFKAEKGTYNTCPKDEALTARRAEVYARAEEIMRGRVQKLPITNGRASGG